MENQEITKELAAVDNETAISLKNAFTPYFEQAEQWKVKAENLVITSIEQVEEMKQAREARLALKNIRVSVENKRKEMKEESLRKGKAIDGMANVIKFLIVPIEEHLEKQEKFIEIQQAKIKAELKDKREHELLQLEVDTTFYNLAEMPEESYLQLLETSKLQLKLKKEAEQKAEQERIAKEKAEAEERERIRVENEKLKKEAEEREKQIAEERAKADAERKRIEAENNKILEAERKEKERIAAELKAKQQKEHEEKDRLAREEKAKKEAEKKALRAPDKDKLTELATRIVSIQMPDVKSDEAKQILIYVQELLNKTSSYIKEKSLSL